ncbi:MAG: exosome complex exonuclease Rrp41 [Candidatus Nanoarchaeia archaeon]|nr:exosome complex exonuclease Rrp41 [Candidatus Nanoarchaeia archaeon]
MTAKKTEEKKTESRKSYKATGRIDKRKATEMRPMEMSIGFLPNCAGSARVKVGNTIAIAGVYGPKKARPKHEELKDKLLLRCYYDLVSFSVPDRARPGPSRRSTELGMVIKSALERSIFTEFYPRSMVEVFIEVVQADAGSRCASIIAASLALADAGIEMRDLMPAVACGKIDDLVCVDLTKAEEDYHEGEGPTDIPIAYLPNQDEITLLQLDGKISKEELAQAIKMGIVACKEIHKQMKQTIRSKYEKR